MDGIGSKQQFWYVKLKLFSFSSQSKKWEMINKVSWISFSAGNI